MSKEARQQEENIKQKIMDGYRRDVCDSEGRTIPMGKRGMSGKGSHFMAPKTELYRKHFDQIVWAEDQ